MLRTIDIHLWGAVLCLAAIGCPASGSDDEVGGSDSSSASSGEVGSDTGSSDATSSDTGSSDATSSDASSSDTSETTGDGDGDGLLPALVECAPRGDACMRGEPDTSSYATLRKDVFLPQRDYSEPNPDPVDGGRIQIAGIAAASGPVADVRISGVPLSTLVTTANGTPGAEWWHVWPNVAVAGEPIWVAFHSRDAAWNSASAVDVEIELAGGELALAGSVPLATTKVPLTYVTVSSDLDEVIVHVQNVDTEAHEVTRVLLDGHDVLAADVACVPDTTLDPGETAMWTIPLCGLAELGAAWTVVVELDATDVSVGTGRVLRPFYPIETWPKGADDPFPACNQANLDAHLEAGFDTFYMYWGEACGVGGAELVNTLGPATDGFNVLVGDDFFWNHMDDPDAGSLITDFSAVAGFLTGDEVDMNVYEDDGAPHAETKAAYARWLWSIYPETLAYNGGATNRNVGTYAGSTDVQGMDFYVAGCAPHITNFLDQPPLRGAYDYLANARRNHMPGTTWSYAQGLHDGSWTGQPNRTEVVVQAMSVIAAGSKGLMWFQTVMSLVDENPDTWDAIAQSNWVFRGLRDHLREGDATGLASTTGEAIVEAIRSRDAMVVPIINLATSNAPTALACGAAALGGPTPHFVMAPQVLDVDVVVPDDFAVADIFEVLVDDSGAQVVDPTCGVSSQDRVITLGGVSLSDDVPVRLLVLARDAALREAIASAMAH